MAQSDRRCRVHDEPTHHEQIESHASTESAGRRLESHGASDAARFRNSLSRSSTASLSKLVTPCIRPSADQLLRCRSGGILCERHAAATVYSVSVPVGLSVETLPQFPTGPVLRECSLVAIVLGRSKRMLEPSWLKSKHAPEMMTSSPICVLFTEGGNGGVAKTEVVLSLIPWYLKHGIEPILLDFDVENTNKSGLRHHSSWLCS